MIIKIKIMIYQKMIINNNNINKITKNIQKTKIKNHILMIKSTI